MSVSLHTDVGDIKIELFCEQCPKSCENFLALCASDYYNGCLFHRNIKDFVSSTAPLHNNPLQDIGLCPERVILALAEGLGIGLPGVRLKPDMFGFPQGFIVQTGDPTGTGKGGTSIWGKKFEDEFKEELKHNARGTVSMANNGPNTNGSQFFFSYGEQPHLDLKYTVFGRIIDGFESLDDLEKMPVNPKTYKPVTEARISSVTIHANPLAG